MTNLNENTELNLEEMDEVSGGRAVAGGMRDKPTTTKAGCVLHKVTATDNLTRIAKQYGTTVTAIMKVNPTITDKNLIRTGYYIWVPKKK